MVLSIKLVLVVSMSSDFSVVSRVERLNVSAGVDSLQLLIDIGFEAFDPVFSQEPVETDAMLVSLRYLSRSFLWYSSVGREQSVLPQGNLDP